MREGLPREAQRIAHFIDVDPAALRLDPIVEHASFATMRAHAAQRVPFAGAHMRDPMAFFSRGPARDHRSELTAELIARFDQFAQRKLPAECARWLEEGQEPRAAAATTPA